MTDDTPCVLVRADLRPSTYQVLTAAAKDRGMTVGDLLSRLADKATAKAPQPARKKYVRVTPELEARIRALHADGLTDSSIARRIGISQGSASRHARRLGLEPNGTGGRATRTG